MANSMLRAFHHSKNGKFKVAMFEGRGGGSQTKVRLPGRTCEGPGPRSLTDIQLGEVPRRGRPEPRCPQPSGEWQVPATMQCLLPRPHSTANLFLLQIASLLKDHERVQSTQTTAPNDEDSDIKKIKKVCTVLPGCTTASALLRATPAPSRYPLGALTQPQTEPAAVTPEQCHQATTSSCPRGGGGQSPGRR